MNRKLFDLVFAVAGELLVLFVVLPLVSTLLGSTPRQFWLALTDPEVLRSIGLTFLAAAIATGLALLTGVPLAYLLARRRFRGQAAGRGAGQPAGGHSAHRCGRGAAAGLWTARSCWGDGWRRWASPSPTTWAASWSPCCSSACRSWST